MALPPTGLTTLLYPCKSVEEMAETLQSNGCLREGVKASDPALIDLLRQTSKEHNTFLASLRPGWTGPTTTDRISAALQASDFLSEKGQELAGG